MSRNLARSLHETSRSQYFPATLWSCACKILKIKGRNLLKRSEFECGMLGRNYAIEFESHEMKMNAFVFRKLQRLDGTLRTSCGHPHPLSPPGVKFLPFGMLARSFLL